MHRPSGGIWWQTYRGRPGTQKELCGGRLPYPEWQRRNRKSNKDLRRRSRYEQVGEKLTRACNLVAYTEQLDSWTVIGGLATIYTIILLRKPFLLFLPMSLPPMQPKCHLDPQQHWVRNPTSVTRTVDECQGWWNVAGEIAKVRSLRA